MRSMDLQSVESGGIGPPSRRFEGCNNLTDLRFRQLFRHTVIAVKADSDYRMPEELTKTQIGEIVAAFKAAAGRANTAGFDALEIHAAHGYLVHEFLSPITNRRTDEYGGSLENRVRFLKEILAAIRSVWPEEKPLWICLLYKSPSPRDSTRSRM